jgi:membrane-associated phospholipid phosphatase
MRRLLLVALLLGGTSAPGALEAQRRPPAEVVWAGAAGTALVGSFLLDETVRREWAQGEPAEWDWLSDRLNPLGKPQYSVLGLGALYLAGRVAGSGGVSDAAWHTGAALLASGVANGTLKYALGRARPRRERGHAAFEPFNPEDHWQSFPSGHTVVVFSLAASASEEAGRPWVSAVSYGTAALVGWSRVYEDRHWASDVVGGAVVGIAMSRATLHWLHAHDGRVRVAVTPSGFRVSLPTR